MGRFSKNYSKIYLKPTERQLELRNVCIESAKSHISEHQEVIISHEKVYSWSGNLVFIIQIKAKPNTGMLLICDKTFNIDISKAGAVKTKELMEDKYKRNKYCIII